MIANAAPQFTTQSGDRPFLLFFCNFLLFFPFHPQASIPR